jgi:hypothetical protein
MGPNRNVGAIFRTRKIGFPGRTQNSAGYHTGRVARDFNLIYKSEDKNNSVD